MPAVAVTNLSISFTSQAPFADWRQPWQDACEETSILMTDLYYAGVTTKTVDKYAARDLLLKILNIKNNVYGWSLDENADKVVSLINNFLPWEAYVADNPTLEQIKAEIDTGRPVIAPVHGKSLFNPHFTNGGPDYHMFVISGYDDATQEFIAQEPGTRYGLDFRYPYDRILNALHDYVPGKTITGRKIAIFTRKNLTNSEIADGDNDGLGKLDEIKYGTILWLADSDGDGFTDGTEVSQGYSPTVNEPALPNGSLIKSLADPKVYLLENNAKQHILNAQVFRSHGWGWGDIVIVSEKFLSGLEEGKLISDL